MKRSMYAIVTAAAVVGCQSPVSRFHGDFHAQSSHRMPLEREAKTASNVDPASSRMKIDPEVMPAGYNHGWGAAQNRSYKERVAVALPSHGGAVPGGPAMQMPSLGNYGHGGYMHGGGMMGGGMPGGLGPRFATGRSQIRFVRPTGMKIAWQAAETGDSFTHPQLEVPARYNFVQARIYRLKLTDIPNRPGLELYPTLEVYPGNAKVDAYLSHNAVPIELTDEDFDQVQAGNFVTKVIYLPDPKYQELAIAGVETLVSTRLDPGVDPIVEANRRGAILAVLRVGSVDLEMPHSPGLFPQPPMAVAAPAAVEASIVGTSKTGDMAAPALQTISVGK